MADWLDDDDHGDEDGEDQTVHVRALVPASTRSRQAMSDERAEAVSSFDDDNDWNW